MSVNPGVTECLKMQACYGEIGGNCCDLINDPCTDYTLLPQDGLPSGNWGFHGCFPIPMIEGGPGSEIQRRP